SGTFGLMCGGITSTGINNGTNGLTTGSLTVSNSLSTNNLTVHNGAFYWGPTTFAADVTVDENVVLGAGHIGCTSLTAQGVIGNGTWGLVTGDIVCQAIDGTGPVTLGTN